MNPQQDRPPLRPEHPVSVGYQPDVQAASWSCGCGVGQVLPHARHGIGARVARRLAGIEAERHARGEDETDTTGDDTPPRT